jgi:hypothetical protein
MLLGKSYDQPSLIPGKFDLDYPVFCEKQHESIVLNFFVSNFWGAHAKVCRYLVGWATPHPMVPNV